MPHTFGKPIGFPPRNPLKPANPSWGYGFSEGSYPDPYPTVPYPKPAWVLKSMIIPSGGWVVDDVVSPVVINHGSGGE